MVSTPGLRPVREGERQLAPDLARGVMLALIAVANSALYLYGRPYGMRQHVIEHGLPDRVTAALTMTFVDGRAYPMFAALFGYGMVQIWNRRRDEEEGRRVLKRRSLWLLLFGAVHAVLLFSGDVLGVYGLLGLAIVRLLRVRDRTLLVLAGVWLVPVALLSALAYNTPRATQERTIFWSLAAEDPLTALTLRPIEWLMTPVGMTGVFTAGLVGVWAGRRDLLSAPDGLLRRAAVWGPLAGTLGGLPVGLTATGFLDVEGPVTVMALNAVHMVTGIAAGLGYAALIALLARRIGTRRGPLVTALSACGQRSMTSYLLQSVVFVALLPPYTIGLGGWLGSAATVALAVGTWAATVVAAEFMRRAGMRGPAEALLRRLAYPRR
ncbi:DUF418 domain-containing protein [Planomonospora venezuelensis]|uniref:Putative membrane protein YeiB n=1 Tax=Planomonospora venezuelensis TaxID=1999 RepID=A0A841D5B8_PLAVE|nr:DUF418 domain-containing protein [Planomonospora venezuelensis]MBB5963548.1 putative membrane protein YeiB [Planomonospora venezuelensis]GIN02067.1 hypothetical protein Pve01_37250 [Planomonospora venezuelensis]